MSESRCLPLAALTAALHSALAPLTAAAAEPVVQERIAAVLDLEPVWAGHSVGFCLLTAPPDQYVAYYDATRQMTVAHRRLAETTWTVQKLPSQVGWDSHNYITMAVDAAGHLHVSGNMHVVPLIYFRTARLGEVTSLERVETMVDAALERRVTYPRFLRGPEGVLLFRYRDGSSGRGNDYYNRYDPATRTWQALLNGPLLDGQGQMNGYFSLPELGPDQRFHMVGVWRDTPDAATNHDPSYARSRDLVHWEKADGTPVAVPMTLGTIDVVEAVPAGQGLVNGNCRLGFDARQRPVVTYHRYDAAGDTQIYAARFEDGRWQVHQVSDWRGYRWEFGGGGTIGFEVQVGGVQADEQGQLSLRFGRPGHSGTWRLDPETLKAVAPLPPGAVHRASLGPVESTFPGIQVRQTGDSGQAEDARTRYVLRWETLGSNRDRPRPPPHPEPTMLRLLRLETPEP